MSDLKWNISLIKSVAGLFFLLTNKMLLVILLFFFGCSSAFSAINTNGYWQAGTLEGISFGGNGTTAQQTGAMTNPDEFCASKGNGYRLPRAGQANIGYLGKEPLTESNVTTGGNFYQSRLVGSLVSEWGAQPSLYAGSGWTTNQYWIALPYSANFRHTINLLNPNSGNLGNYSPSSQLPVACVRALL